MTKKELLKRLELLPDDCEIKIKNDGILYEPLESGWRYKPSKDLDPKFQNEWSSKVQSDVDKTKSIAIEYILTF